MLTIYQHSFSSAQFPKRGHKMNKLAKIYFDELEVNQLATSEKLSLVGGLAASPELIDYIARWSAGALSAPPAGPFMGIAALLHDQ